MVTNVSGSFNNFSVTAETTDDNFANATVAFSADTTSITTNSEQRDTHLKSADFFDAEHYPAITFKATQFEKTGNGSDYQLTGDLTMKGITKSIKLHEPKRIRIEIPITNFKS